MAVEPNNDLLAAWGLYGLVYAAIGVAHAMQGPRRKWRPRIALLTLALGFTAAAHLFAAIARLARRAHLHAVPRGVQAQLRHADPHLLRASARSSSSSRSMDSTGRIQLRLHRRRSALLVLARRRAQFRRRHVQCPDLIATGVAAVLYFAVRRSRYFGNTAPLLVVLALAPLVTTQTVSAPWLWTLPFLFTFIGGVFADALESRYRKLFLVLTGMALVAQALECLTALPGIAVAS